jgi:hypothetical protein
VGGNGQLIRYPRDTQVLPMYQIDFGANYSANLRSDQGFQLDQPLWRRWPRVPDTEEVTGSNPVAPTTHQASSDLSLGA